MTTRLSIWAGAMAFALFAATAAADNQERITLTDGSVYVGEIVEKVPNDHVTLKLATGEIKRFEWAMIVPQAAAPPPAAPPPTQPPPPAGPRNAVHVVMDSTRPGDTELLKVEGTGEIAVATSRGMAYGMFEQYSTVCAAPCDVEVDGNGTYKIGGRVTPTGNFSFAGLGNPVNLHVNAGSRGVRTGGLFLTIGGASLLPVGIVLFALGFALQTEERDSNFNVVSTGPNSFLLTSGAIFGGLGIVMLGIGIPMLIAGKTSVTTPDGESVGLRLSPNVALTPRGLVF
jgi:hypothetical protein